MECGLLRGVAGVAECAFPPLRVVVVVDHCDVLNRTSFLQKFLHWSMTKDIEHMTHPIIFRYSEQDNIFINSQFRLLLNFRRVPVTNQMWNDIVKNRFIDLRLSCKQIEDIVWLNIVETKSHNFLHHIRNNQRLKLLAQNDLTLRRTKLVSYLRLDDESTVNGLIESEELLLILKKFDHERQLLVNTYDEHQSQEDLLLQRGQCYRSTAKSLTIMYDIMREDNNVCFHVEANIFDWFIHIVISGLSKRMENNDPSNKVQAREIYLRCFEKLYNYLSSMMTENDLILFLTIFTLKEMLIIKDDNNNHQIITEHDLKILKTLLLKQNPHNRKIIPHFLYDTSKPSYLTDYTWQCAQYLQENHSSIFENLCLELVENKTDWLEYLNDQKIDLLNKCPFKKQNLSIIHRIILWLTLYSTTFVDPVNEIVLLSKKLKIKQNIVLISAMDLLNKKYTDETSNINSLLLKSIQKQNWLIIKDLHLSEDFSTLFFQNLYNMFLLSCSHLKLHENEINDLELDQFDQLLFKTHMKFKLWLICDQQYQDKIPSI
ncbi:unnamed protein product [Didymodactylos carnosus]|uniref:Uncharacterized protein n=1 Tax=Didymodactylos carnosus TaxID=1234261 RepID=A0A8S2TST5_9BILA|nr:unnamed protein product [Didymodactylos carnosus]